MTISSVGLDPAVGSPSGRSAIRQAHQDFDQLFQSLQAGNLSAAQQAYSDFQQIQAGLANQTTASSQVGSASATTATNPVLSDWSALGQALQSGSLPSAQDALGKLTQDATTAWQSHLQQEAQKAQSVYALMQGVQGAAASSGITPANAATASNPVQNDLNSLAQALQSGDSSGAQKLLAQLEQDLQSSNQASGNVGGHHHHHHHHQADATAANAPAGVTVSTSTISVSSTTSSSTSGSATA